MGGWNLIADVLLRETPRKADPLGPDNKLVVAPGVLTGLAVSGLARTAFGAKSPLTDGWGASEAGGYFGSELKRAGFDAVVVEGKSPHPVYLHVRDGTAEIRDASHHWGKDTGQTLRDIRAELGESRARAALIGPAGENQVRYACIVNDLRDAAGRCGLGAVMGSKNLKAIVARGRNALGAADEDKVREIARRMVDKVRSDEAWGLPKTGTGANLDSFVHVGNLPIRNFQDGEFDAAKDISAETILERFGVGMEACYACAVHCKKHVTTAEPIAVDGRYGGPEYESIAALGSNCGIADPLVICKANELCNAYSLDTISTGVTIAFAMECFDRGLLSLQDTGGLELRFGNAHALLEMIRRIAYREGQLGNLLAEGSWRAARAIGPPAGQYAMHVKGQELPMHEPRVKWGLGLGYAVSPTGADHLHGIHDTGLDSVNDDGIQANSKLRQMGVVSPLSVRDLGPDKVRAALYWTLDWVMINCLPVCLMIPRTLEERAELIKAATGWDVTSFELMKVAERAYTLARVYNVREGFGAADDVLPDRLFGPTTNGALMDGGIDRDGFAAAVRTYYGMLGWDSETGVPKAAKLHELGVSWAVDHLPKG
jgi:aldehyde:ferredoxin oxidoreductase